MDYSELLFAAALNNLAQELAIGARQRYGNSIDSLEEPAYSEHMGRWNDQHPVSSYYPSAFAQIQDAATFVKSKQ